MEGYQFKRKADLLEEANIYNSIIMYLQTLPVDLPDPQYVIKIVEETFNLAICTIIPLSIRRGKGDDGSERSSGL